MKIRPSYVNLWSVAFPITLAGLGETIVEVTDTAFLGRYGTTELGAIAVADSIYQVLTVPTLGLAIGMQIMIARRAGQGAKSRIGRVFDQGLGLAIVASALLILVVSLCSAIVIDWTISSPDVQTAVSGYLRIAVFGLVVNAINLAYSGLYIGLARTRVLIGAVAALAVTNIVLDAILIFGRFGLPRLGIEGAAVASVAAEVAAAVFTTVYAWRRGDIRRYRLFACRSWRPAAARRLIGVSLPVSLDALVETIRWLVFFLIIEQLGEGVLAATSAVYACYALLLIPVVGFAEAGCSMVSNLIGQGKSARIGLLLRRAMLLSYAVTMPCALVALVFAEPVLCLLTTDEETVAAAAGSLRLAAMAMILVVPGDTLVFAGAGTGDTRSALVIETVLTACVLTYVVVAAIVLSLPLEMIWLAVAIEGTVRIVLSSLHLRSRLWHRLRV
jgi:putative MATE family efflux protein